MIKRYSMEWRQTNFTYKGQRDLVENLILNLLNDSAIFKITKVSFVNKMMMPNSLEAEMVFELELDYNTLVEPRINLQTIQRSFKDQWSELTDLLTNGNYNFG